MGRWRLLTGERKRGIRDGTSFGMKSTSVACLAVVFLAAAAATDAAKSKSADTRMYNAQDSRDGQFPYVVFHMRRSGRRWYSCTGGLIDDQWVLTAAHCLSRTGDPSDNIFVAGRSNMRNYVAYRFKNASASPNADEERFGVQERRGAEVFMHPQYSPTGSHDIGLVRLNRPFVMNDRVRAMPATNEPFERTTNCTAVGYGLSENNARRYHLQYVEGMPAKPARMCRFQRYRDVICLGDRSRGICQGDSGGPLVCGGSIRGVASHGLSTTANCGQGVIEQYYADVHRNRAWINSVRNEKRRSKKN